MIFLKEKDNMGKDESLQTVSARKSLLKEVFAKLEENHANNNEEEQAAQPPGRHYLERQIQ